MISPNGSSTVATCFGNEFFQTDSLEDHRSVVQGIVYEMNVKNCLTMYLLHSAELIYSLISFGGE